MSKFKIKSLVLSLPLLAALSTAAFAAGFSDAQTKTFATSPKSDYLAGAHQKWASSAFLAIRLKLLTEKKRLIRSAHLVTVIWTH